MKIQHFFFFISLFISQQDLYEYLISVSFRTFCRDSSLTSNKWLSNDLLFVHLYFLLHFFGSLMFNLLLFRIVSNTSSFGCRLRWFSGELESDFFSLDAHPFGQNESGDYYGKFYHARTSLLTCIQGHLAGPANPRKNDQIEQASEKDCQDNFRNRKPDIALFAFILARSEHHDSPQIQKTWHDESYQKDRLEHETSPMSLQVKRRSTLEQKDAKTLSNQIRCREKMHNFCHRFQGLPCLIFFFTFFFGLLPNGFNLFTFLPEFFFLSLRHLLNYFWLLSSLLIPFCFWGLFVKLWMEFFLFAFFHFRTILF